MDFSASEEQRPTNYHVYGHWRELSMKATAGTGFGLKGVKRMEELLFQQINQ